MTTTQATTRMLRTRKSAIGIVGNTSPESLSPVHIESTQDWADHEASQWGDMKMQPATRAGQLLPKVWTAAEIAEWESECDRRDRLAGILMGAVAVAACIIGLSAAAIFGA